MAPSFRHHPPSHRYVPASDWRPGPTDRAHPLRSPRGQPAGWAATEGHPRLPTAQTVRRPGPARPFSGPHRRSPRL